MARPMCCRRVSGKARCRAFKPAGIPCSALEAVVVTEDELEAVRLADLMGLYQEEAARQMGVSRPTFGRIVETARRKVALALVEGRMLRIEGGVVEVREMKRFRCSECGHVWEVPYGGGRPGECPACKSGNLHRAVEDRGCGGRGHGHGGRCRRASAKDVNRVREGGDR